MGATSSITVVFLLVFLFLVLRRDELGFGLSFTLGCPTAEREALLKFKDSWSEGRWSEGRNCCTWDGISCDNITGHVNRLDLSQTWFFTPQLDPSLAELTHLRYLDLSGGDFGGSPIPDFIGSFKHLRYLNLSNAGFGGVVPSQLGNLTNLHALDLSNTQSYWNLTANDLKWVSGLSNLQSLDLSSVNLTLAQTSLQALDKLPSLLDLRIASCSLTTLRYVSHAFYNSSWLSAIEHLDLSSNFFKVDLPSQFLANMTSLRFLDLSGNNFTGSIPQHSLKNMRDLEFLSLRENSFSQLDEGTIMGAVENLCRLKVLDLSRNVILRGEIGGPYGFNGLFPSWVQNLSLLEVLDLSHNRLNGYIPEFLGQCRRLKVIDLSSNSFEGVVSNLHLGNLSNLDSLDLSFNPGLSLSFNPSWKPPFQLSSLRMSSCGSQTQLPRWIQTQYNLQELDLSNNRIHGVMLDWSQNSNLMSIDLSNNSIEGAITHFPPNVSTIDLSYNWLSGPVSQDQSIDNDGVIGKSLCSLEFLEFLNLENNKLSGAIPFDCRGNSSSLTFLSLAFNKLSGVIPTSISQLASLKVLNLNSNLLEGEIPATWSGRLLILDLGENNLSGALPSFERSPLMLWILRLRDNRLSGDIPEELCSQSDLQMLDLAGNNFTGSIPRCFGKMFAKPWVRLLGYLVYGALQRGPIPHSCTGSPYATCLPARRKLPCDQDCHPFPDGANTTVVLEGKELTYTKTLKLVVALDLSCNGLQGSIPEELTNLSRLIGLNLSYNHLTGRLPKKIGQMTSLTSLDLSNNNLSGAIPSSLSSLTLLSHLNLSHNKLEGKIPTGPQLQTLNDDPSIYAGNPGLCGDPLSKKCPWDHEQPPAGGGGGQGQQQQEEDDEDDDNRETVLFYMVVVLGFITGFWGVIGLLLLKKEWRIALFSRVEDVVDYLYVQVVLRIKRLRN